MSHDHDLPILRTKRLILRPLTDDDLPFLREMDTDPEVMKYIGDGSIRTEEYTVNNLQKVYARYEMFGMGLYLVENALTKEKLGRAGLFAKQEDNELIWEIGYGFKKSAWGKGYATEAAEALRDWGLENLNTDYLICFIREDNLDSIHVASKLGMNHWKEEEVDGHNHVIYRTL